MDTINITLQDNTNVTVEKGKSLALIFQDLRLKPRPVAAEVNGKIMDLSTTIEHDANISAIDLLSKRGLEIYRHSTSHIMAQAVTELYPDVKVTIGPSIEDGFYYDFDYEATFSPEDLVQIEKKMKEIISSNYPFQRMIMGRQEAIEFYRDKNENYKVELLENISDDTVTLYKIGNFTDLCRGPHLPSTGVVKAFKLTSTAGAYWRGDERNKMLQRIYGTAFPDRKELKMYLKQIEEAKKRDHRKLGRELDLFNIYEEAGAG